MNIVQRLLSIYIVFLGFSAEAQDDGLTAKSDENTSQVTASQMSEEAQSEALEVPAPKRSLLKTAATKDFNKPLYFDQLDNGVILPPLDFEYDLSEEKKLKIGSVTFSEKNFYFSLLPLGKTHSQLRQVLDKDEASKTMLVMFWPEPLFNNGTLEMISRTGTVLWTYSFSSQDRNKWAYQLGDWRKKIIAKGISAKSLSYAGLFGSQFAIDAEQAKAPFWAQKESFRFCLTQSDGKNTTKMCSQRYGTKSAGKKVVMGKVRTDLTTPRVLLQNEEAPLKKTVSVAADLPFSFFSELASGESYEFITLPNKLQLMDIADTKNADILRIVGYGTRPLGRTIILNPDQYSALTKLLGFEPTIGDPRKFWAMAIKKDEPMVYLPGQGGGLFKQRFELTEIPRNLSRVFLKDKTPTGTYIDGIKLEGRKQPSAKISSTQNSAVEDVKDPAHFIWSFAAAERGQINRSYLNVEFEGKTYKSFYELYKGYPRELSGRFTGVQTSGEMIIMGEVAYNQWFEDIFSWENYWLSRQRWGISAKYFQSFNQLKVNSAGDTASLNVMTMDLKYRATPGLWGRDESVGGMLSYQNVSFDKMKAPMLGVGAFWARSMPRVFDEIFNLVPFMRYPKWVDMEFIYYVNSMDSNVTLNSSMSLNFHGKVLWTETLFGEAGFGLKRYGFSDVSLNQKAELNTFYGTVGLGLNF